MATGSEVIKKLKNDVGNTFEEVSKALEMRKKLLLRQIDVIASQSQKQNALNDDIKFIPDDEIDLMESIRSFGKFNLGHLNFASDVYVSEDYICPTVDHETMYKCLNTKDEVDCKPEPIIEPENKEILVDFFNNKILQDNINTMNESIVNITLKEAKELIGRTTSNSLEAAINNNENEKIAQSSQTELNTNKKKKPNITINNCSGTINLKNISNLTINCSGQTSIQTAKTKDVGALDNSTRTNSTDSEIVTSTIPSDDDDNTSTKDNENNSANCEFYNRLIKEIKNSLKQHHPHKTTTDARTNNNSSSSSDSNANDTYNRKLLLKNFENLKIVLENNENDTHPVQIEQWLTEIISETEIEPMPNTEILEHSKLGNKELC